MKKTIIISVLVIFLSHSAQAGRERIAFNLRYGFIKGGEAVLVISDTIFNNRKALHYALVGKTTGITDRLFGVNDIYETTVDAETRFPLKSVRNIKEGRYRYYNETQFFHENDSLYSQRSGGRKTPGGLLDIISVFFYFIHNHLIENMTPGSSVIFPTFHADKISDVSVRYLGDEQVKTNLGMINCYVLIPSVDKGRVLNRSDGLKFFISKETRLPVLLEFDMRVGSLKAELVSYTVEGKAHTTR